MEEVLLQYGALGISFILFMGFFYKYYNDTKIFQDKMTTVVENNTIALTKVHEIISMCPNTKRKV